MWKEGREKEAQEEGEERKWETEEEGGENWQLTQFED